jgi:hypothetical protein
MSMTKDETVVSCSKCGHKVTLSMQACPNCGADLKWEEDDTPPDPIDPAAAPSMSAGLHSGPYAPSSAYLSPFSSGYGTAQTTYAGYAVPFVPRFTPGFLEAIEKAAAPLKPAGKGAAAKAAEAANQITSYAKIAAMANPANLQEVGAAQLLMLNKYYQSVLQQAQQSFRWAFVAAGIGLLFFLAAITFLALQMPENISIISLICGALVEVIAAINFYLYGQTSRQSSAFHVLLDRLQRFIIANSVATTILGPARDAALTDLMRIIANAAPMGQADEAKSEASGAKTSSEAPPRRRTPNRRSARGR